jgi:iron complex transport system ATP-binding protein
MIAGTVYIDGINMRVMGGRDLAMKMSVMLTDRVRPDLMTCRELVSAGRYPYTGSFGILSQKDREIVNKTLERVNAADIADKDVSSISDGQRQRILLARALCQEPEIIVLDEPTSYLDIRNKIELLDILSDMAKKEKIAVVMSLHEIDLAERVSDKIVCVKGDRIYSYGSPSEIFSDTNVAELYDIKKGYFNALLGSIELKKPTGEIKHFVIGGNGTRIPFYRALQKKGIAFAAGILPENDLDTAVAKPLASEVVISEAFMPVDEHLIARATEIIDSVTYIADCGCPVGEYNRANAELIRYAEKKGKTIIKTPEQISEADI